MMLTFSGYLNRRHKFKWDATLRRLGVTMIIAASESSAKASPALV